MLKLEEMLDDALELAFYSPLLFSAQVLHLLSQVQKVEWAVPALIGEATQRRRLIASPGVEVVAVKPLRARSHRLASMPQTVTLAPGRGSVMLLAKSNPSVARVVRQPAPFGRLGTMSTASPSRTFLSPTVQMVVMRTRRLSVTTSATCARAITVSPIRTGARKRMLWLT
jgi:hypothetical protein